MRTDRLFHEYFALAPQALFELLQLTPGCTYTFHSPVVKANEIEEMLLLTPLEETVARQELIQFGRLAGLKEGLQDFMQEFKGQ